MLGHLKMRVPPIFGAFLQNIYVLDKNTLPWGVPGDEDVLRKYHIALFAVVALLVIGVSIVIGIAQQPENVDLQYLAEHISEFENKKVMVTGMVRYYILGDVVIGFYDNASEEEANALIESYGLTWEYYPQMFESGFKWGVVKVPIRQELQWIETFEKENIVRYTGLDYYVTIPEIHCFWIDGVVVTIPMGEGPPPFWIDGVVVTVPERMIVSESKRLPPGNSIVAVIGKVARVQSHYTIFAESWTVASE